MMSAFVEKSIELAQDICASNGTLEYVQSETKLRAHLEAREAVTSQLLEALIYVIDNNRAPDGYARAICAIQAYDEASK